MNTVRERIEEILDKEVQNGVNAPVYNDAVGRLEQLCQQEMAAALARFRNLLADRLMDLATDRLTMDDIGNVIVETANEALKLND